DGAVFSGTIPLDDRLPEGEYVLRAYTDNLRNLGGDYFFHRPIRLLNPYATVARWDRGNGQGGTSSLNSMGNGSPIGNNGLPITGNVSPIGDGQTSARRPTAAHLSTEVHPSAAARPAAGTENQFDISFFPEGGQLITDVPCRVAFKALYPDGSPAAVR